MVSAATAFLLGVLAALALLPGGPARAGGCERRLVAQVPLRDDAGFLSIAADIGGRPVRLMIDTGSDAGLITPQAVRELGLAGDGRARIALHGTGGIGRSSGIALVPRLTVGTLRLDDLPLPIGALPGAPNLVPKVAGFLGGDVLSRFDLDIEVKRGALSFYAVALPSLACAPPPAWRGRFSTVQLKAHGGRLSLSARLDGRPIEALLDTGARSQIVSWAAARHAGVTADALEADPGGVTRGVDMREQTYHWHRFATLVIGNEIVRSPVLTVAPLAGQFDMLLGSDWFSAHQAWLSYATGQLFFRSARR